MIPLYVLYRDNRTELVSLTTPPPPQDPVQRTMALSETCVIERDPATYQIATIRPLCDVRQHTYYACTYS